VEVYPNPTRSDNIHLRIQIPGSAELRVQIIDQLGRSYFEDKLSNASGQGEAEVSIPGGLKDGVYFLRLTYGERQIVKRVMIKN
jgi:hypothetical protein